ncbi:MAG: YncE family protein [Proteiniphilum sp.]|jgi:DNA-binding beta-propeller fold protein YncE|nr:YncE family protein [Proteiniphilum sp.]
MKKQAITIYLFVVTLLLVSCRKDVELLLSEVTFTDPGASAAGRYAGLYLLNEGNMGSNKATLDFYDFVTGNYRRNIYAERNPSVPKELGDVGNDLQLHGSRLYAVINASNKIEVMDARTTGRIGRIEIPNCRHITFHEGYAYVTSYAGPIEIDPEYKQKGYVARIDTATLEVTGTCVVGYQPDGIAVSDGNIYVANSGGYRGAGKSMNYERTVSVISIATFRETARIDVDMNLHRIKADSRGDLWVSSRSDYHNSPSRLYFIDHRKQAVTDTIDLPVSNFAFAGDSLYLIGMDESVQRANNFSIVDMATREVVNSAFISDGTEKGFETPYGITVHPETRDIYITDAGDYINPGYLYRFDREGKKMWSMQTGDIPAHFVFLPKNTYIPSFR